jgi:hypothetical protein
LKGAQRFEARLRREAERTLELAEEADRADEAAGAQPDFPAEIARLEDRLKALAAGTYPS